MNFNFKVESVNFGNGDDGYESEEFAELKSNDGTLRLQLYGSCCSSSYFEENSVKDLQSLVGETITKIERVESSIPDKDGDYESIEYSALKITTNKQSLTIDWRNESNGYYSGWCNIFLNGKNVDEK